ncbi:MAG: FkbM family methyltransferase [Patescibacteria group bacterium]
MSKSLRHRWQTIRRLDLRWVWRYGKKRFLMYLRYFYSRFTGRTFWPVKIEAIEIKLSFTHPYQHHFARQLHQGKHERALLSLWRQQATQIGPGLIFDVGGYNGIYGLLAAKSNPHAHVVIVEPDQVNIAHIKANIALNRLGNVQILEAVLSGNNRAVPFKKHDGGTGGSIVAGSNETITVPSVILSEWVHAFGRIPVLMKWDAVGAETAALLAAREVLVKAERMKLLLEFYPAQCATERQTQDSFWAMLRELGYQWLYLYPRSDGVAVYYFVFKGNLV